MAIAMLLLTFGVTAAQDTTVNVTLGMSEFKFDPSELTVAAGTEVTFNVSNTGQFPHNVTFVAPDGTESNLFPENVATGQSATGKFTFNTAGEWKMYCPVGQHEEQGMVGKVTVTAAAAAASGTQATAAATPATLPATGGVDPVVWAALAALVLVGAGLWLRRTGTVRG
jgi:LPXTG-motif cell wall-anchored protein